MLAENKAKRYVKLTISLLVFLADYVFACVRRAMGGGGGPARCVILYYHSITEDQRGMFASQMDDVLRLAKPISADRKAMLSGSSRYVAITFDDGFENVLHNALPEMETRGIPATIFVITDSLGRLPNWQRFIADYNNKEKVMTADQLLALPRSLITIGSHTRTHPVLTSLSDSEAKREIVDSGVYLENLLGRKIELFSFPYGAYSQNLIRLCKEAGYERVFTIAPVLGMRKPDEFVTGRIGVEPTCWPIEFRLKVVGAYRWLAWAGVWKHGALRFAACCEHMRKNDTHE